MDVLRTITRRSKPANNRGAEHLQLPRYIQTTASSYVVHIQAHIPSHVAGIWDGTRKRGTKKTKGRKCPCAHSSHGSVDNDGAGQMVLCVQQQYRHREIHSRDREKTHTPVQQDRAVM